MNNFNYAYQYLSKAENFEAGIHQNKGESTVTYCGIYKKYHKDWEGWSYLDRGDTPPATLVSEFYRTKFWNNPRIQCELLPEGVDMIVFDFAVTSDPTTSAKVLQKTLGVKEDGWVGNKTLAKLEDKTYNTEYAEDFLVNLTRERIEYYFNLNNKTYENGWLNRAISCHTKANNLILPF